MKVLWKADLGQGKHDPLEVTHVVTKSGSQISAELVVLATDQLGSAWVRCGELEKFSPATPGDNSDGLLEVLEAQMAAIDELSKAAPPSDEKLAKDHAALTEWADQFPVLVEELCTALGFARNPVGPTGIPELDRIVGLAR